VETSAYGRETPGQRVAVRRRATETKSALKTSEFWAYLGILIALFIAGAMIDDDGATSDVLTANEVWLLAVVLTFGYMFSRGRAKSFASDPYTATADDTPGAAAIGRRLVTETKAAFKTTEFWAYVLLLIALFVAGKVTNADDGGTDTLRADDVWLFAIILTVGYLVSRGLAKAGSRDPYWDEPDAAQGPGLGERVKAAAETLRSDEGTQSGGGEGGAPGARY
jgi:hypothetical protein